MTIYHILFLQVYASKETPTWSKRDVYVEDQMKRKICLKLWNDKTNLLKETDVGTSITITNLEVSSYQDKNQLHTTDLTDIKVYF